MSKLLWWLCALLLLAASAYGQVNRGALTATVKDSSGLAVLGATVTAIQNAIGSKRVAIISKNGIYDIPELPVGTYTVTFTLKGFQTMSLRNVVGAMEHTTTLNAVLRVSGSSERVEVPGSAQQLDQTSNSLALLIPRARPNGRDIISKEVL